MKRPQIEVDVVELDRLLDRGTTAPLSVADADKIKTTLHALLDMLAAKRSSEKTRKVFPEAGVQEAAETQTAEGGKRAPAKREGHGRTPASAYKGAEKVPVPHAELQHGCACPLCPKGKVYAQRQPKTLVRIVGQAPLAATLYELEQLRCNGCGQVFTAPQPEGVGPEKFDETAAAMIAQLKYGSGMPWTRLAALEKAMGVPLPAAAQWEVVEDAAASIICPGGARRAARGGA